jgi:high affinity Mn2+ porin
VSSYRIGQSALVLALAAGLSHVARAQADVHPRSWLPQFLGAQFTVIGQYLAPFAAPYAGPNSLTSHGDHELTHTYGAYVGLRMPAHLEAYLDVEMARGAAVGHAVGLAGITNGDVIRQGSVDLGQGPYIARAFVRFLVPLSHDVDTASRAMDQLPGAEPASRLELKIGKLAATDDFDQNRYANSTRLQFCDWGLFNNSAWDYAADTRGYSYGVLVGWVHPRWTLKLGSYLMPTFANGNILDWSIRHAHGDNLELTLTPDAAAPVIRLLGYQNHARMGSYAEALARAQGTGQPPNIVADDQPGRHKYGFALNVEEPLADSGETGAFLRLGWNDGRTEDFAFTEVDRHVSAGLQLAGARWHRRADRFGIAVVAHGLSPDHRAYLEAGGIGFLLGDGRLNYGQERVLEGYYWLQLGRHAATSLGCQVVDHPGYNRDRGPAVVGTLRFNLRY